MRVRVLQGTPVPGGGGAAPGASSAGALKVGAGHGGLLSPATFVGRRANRTGEKRERLMEDSMSS